MLYTFSAPFCSMQSVKPPVDAPTSMQVFPSSVIGKSCMAFSSFKPPRLTYFSALPRTSIAASSLTVSPGLSNF